MKLSDLKSGPRHALLAQTTEGVLREIDAPISTSELVKRIARFLGCEEPTTYVAKELQRVYEGGHPLRRSTGETFRKYGRSMPRYEWLPSHSRRTAVAPDLPSQPPPSSRTNEGSWRAYRVREIEAGRRDPGPWVAPDADIDAWTVEPEAVQEDDMGEFMED